MIRAAAIVLGILVAGEAAAPTVHEDPATLAIRAAARAIAAAARQP